MGLAIDTTSTAVDLDQTKLIRLETVKSRIGISDTSNDDVISELIDEASQLVTDFVGYDLAQKAYVETIPGSQHRFLLLSRMPINSVSSITFDGSAITDYTIHDAASGILYRELGWTRSIGYYGPINIDPLPGSEIPNWIVTYVAGFKIPGEEGELSDGEYNLPRSIQAHVFTVVKTLYFNRQRDPNVKSRRVEEFEEVYGTDSINIGTIGVSGLPLSVEKGLSPWKRFV
jgi:hypothetical protein